MLDSYILVAHIKQANTPYPISGGGGGADLFIMIQYSTPTTHTLLAGGGGFINYDTPINRLIMSRVSMNKLLHRFSSRGYMLKKNIHDTRIA